jgi:hypothetical protein
MPSTTRISGRSPKAVRKFEVMTPDGRVSVPAAVIAGTLADAVAPPRRHGGALRNSSCADLRRRPGGAGARRLAIRWLRPGAAARRFLRRRTWFFTRLIGWLASPLPLAGSRRAKLALRPTRSKSVAGGGSLHTEHPDAEAPTPTLPRKRERECNANVAAPWTPYATAPAGEVEPRFPCWRYADLVGRSLPHRARLLRTMP